MNDKQKEILLLQIGMLVGISEVISSMNLEKVNEFNLSTSLWDIAETLKDTFFPEANK